MDLEKEREAIAKARREIIRDGERFLARNRVPSHLARSVKATMQRCRDSLRGDRCAS
jgi:hypothetical protein